MLMFHCSPGGSESWCGQRRPQPQNPHLGKVLHSAWMYRSGHSEWQENIPKPPCGPLLNWEVPLSPLAIILTPYWICFFYLRFVFHCFCCSSVSSVQVLSCVRLLATPWTAARQASLSITNSQSLLKLMSVESVMPSNHLILCRPQVNHKRDIVHRIKSYIMPYLWEPWLPCNEC